MSVVRVDQYRSDGRHKLHSWGGWSMYAAFTELPDGQGLVKIGISTVPMGRLYDVHCNSPFPIGAALWAHVGNKSQAFRVEKYLKRRFAERQTRGEWFLFDLKSPVDKDAFHSACRAAYARATGDVLAWRKVTLEQIRIANSLSNGEWRA